MRRLLAILAALVLALSVGVPVAAHDGDDARRDRLRDGDDDHDDDHDDEADDDEADDDDDDDDERGRNRRRNRHRGRGGRDDTVDQAGTPAPPGGRPAAAASVQVNDRSFAPATVTVAVGATVTWDNVSRDHTVTADDGSFDSGVFDAGQTFSQTFPTAGTVDYRCLIHPEMTGTVTVGDGPGAEASPGTTSTPAQSSASPPSGQRASTRAGSGLPDLRTASAPPPVAAAASADTVTVDVVDFAFAPDTLTVASGTTVRWRFTGEAPHTVTAATFDSGMVMAGDTFEQTFDEPGTVEYRCELHPQMAGTVAIVDSAAPTSQRSGRTAGDTGPSGADESNDATPALATTGAGLAAGLGAVIVLSAGTAAVAVSRRRRSPMDPHP